MADNHESLRGGLLRFFDEPGKATSVVCAYVHDGASVQAQLNIGSKSDAAVLLVQLERWKSALYDIIERGTV